MPKIAILLGGMGLNAELTQKAISDAAWRGDASPSRPMARTCRRRSTGPAPRAMRSCCNCRSSPSAIRPPIPGPKTLMTGADADANLDALVWHMGRFAGYAGITNYMGARFLGDARRLRPVFAEMKKRGLVFLDDGAAGREHDGSRSAKVVGLPVARRHQRDRCRCRCRRASTQALAELEAEARVNGVAIGTGTGLEITIDAVEQWSRSLAEKGIMLVPVSAAYRGPSWLMVEARVGPRLPPLRGRHAAQPEGLVWIGRRADKPNDEGAGQWWQMPQGGIDKGEDPRRPRCANLGGTAVTSAEIIAEAPDWYQIRSARPSHRQILGRQISRPDAEMVRFALHRRDSEIDLEAARPQAGIRPVALGPNGRDS